MDRLCVQSIHWSVWNVPPAVRHCDSARPVGVNILSISGRIQTRDLPSGQRSHAHYAPVVFAPTAGNGTALEPSTHISNKKTERQRL